MNLQNIISNTGKFQFHFVLPPLGKWKGVIKAYQSILVTPLLPNIITVYILRISLHIVYIVHLTSPRFLHVKVITKKCMS